MKKQKKKAEKMDRVVTGSEVREAGHRLARAMLKSLLFTLYK